jgi:hypothetical protein
MDLARIVLCHRERAPPRLVFGVVAFLSLLAPLALVVFAALFLPFAPFGSAASGAFSPGSL